MTTVSSTTFKNGDVVLLQCSYSTKNLPSSTSSLFFSFFFLFFCSTKLLLAPITVYAFTNSVSACFEELNSWWQLIVFHAQFCCTISVQQRKTKIHFKKVFLAIKTVMNNIKAPWQNTAYTRRQNWWFLSVVSLSSVSRKVFTAKIENFDYTFSTCFSW